MTKKDQATDRARMVELLLQALETEKGGKRVYETALRCVQNEDLREEWEKYLDQTERHVDVVAEICRKLDVDPDAESPGRGVVRHMGDSFVHAMEMALASGDAEAAQLVAAECVVLAETKDHMNWELLGELASTLAAEEKKAIVEAHEDVEEEEDEHLYHTMGWSRELWMDYLGMPAVLPPPEETKDVKTAIGAARAKQSRSEML